MEVLAMMTGAVALARQILDLSAVAKDTKAKEMVGELRLQLAELKIKLADLIEENDQLKREARKAQTTPVVTIKDGLYYKVDGDGPFCTTCYDSSRTLIRLAERPQNTWRMLGRWRCGVCNSLFGGKPKA